MSTPSRPSNPVPTNDRKRAEHRGPERRRPQVLDTALEIAAQHGLAGVTMATISARMGVSRPVVYDCYPGRGELLAALLDRETEVALGRLLAIMPPLKTGSVEQMFVDGFRSLLADVRERPASWQMIFADDPDPVLSEAISRGRAAVTAKVAVVMRPLLERWQVADIDRDLAALTQIFVGICESAVRMLLDSRQAWDAEVLAQIVGGAAYRALRATA
ncbi:MAG TPA: helix-turn-helix domain-containing protein [Mycobacterium sp.]